MCTNEDENDKKRKRKRIRKENDDEEEEEDDNDDDEDVDDDEKERIHNNMILMFFGIKYFKLNPYHRTWTQETCTHARTHAYFFAWPARTQSIFYV